MWLLPIDALLLVPADKLMQSIEPLVCTWFVPGAPGVSALLQVDMVLAQCASRVLHCRVTRRPDYTIC